MLKRLLLLLPLIIASASAYASIEDTYVTFTNNTNEPVAIHGVLTTVDHDFQKGSDWDDVVETIKPYESKQVLWFTRHLDLKSDVDYQFDLLAHPANRAGGDVDFQFKVKGNHYLGSKMINAIRFPGHQAHDVLSVYGLEHYSAHFWQRDYTIHARRWKPRTSLFSNVHIVLDNPVFATDDTAGSRNAFKILTYNTQLQPFYTRPVNDLNQPAIREKDIVARITNYDAVIFEELFDRSLRETLTQDMASVYPYHTTVVGADDDYEAWTGGVMIFSKWPIEKEAQFVFKNATGSDAYAAKGVGYARINKDGQYYNLFGTHLEANNAVSDVHVRRKQLAELEAFVERLNIDHSEPLLVGGDMNIDEFSVEANTLYDYLHAEPQQVLNKGYPFSFDGPVNTMTTDPTVMRLDYVLYNKHYRVPKRAYSRVFVLRALADERMWPKFDLSDHFPVEAYFEF